MDSSKNDRSYSVTRTQYMQGGWGKINPILLAQVLKSLMDLMNKFRTQPIGSEERDEQEVSVMSPELDFKDIQWQGGGEMGGRATFWRHRGQ